MKGLFMIVFHNLEDQERVFENDPYCYNLVRLYLTFWREKFIAKKENFQYAPVWIHFYFFPMEFWLPKTLEAIGTKMGTFVKLLEALKLARYTSYARICVYLDISQVLPREICLI